MIRTVIFDIDNTIHSYTNANVAAKNALKDYFQKNFGISAEELDLLWKQGMKIQEETLGMDNVAIHDIGVRMQIILEEKGINPIPHSGKLHYLYWDTFMEQVRPEPGVVEGIRSLKDQNIRIGIATDMCVGIQYRKLEKLQLLDVFDFIVTSQGIGYEKPNPRFFEAVLSKTLCKREECLMIGDNWKKDIMGALHAGMHAAWYCPDINETEMTEEQKLHAFHSYYDLNIHQASF